MRTTAAVLLLLSALLAATVGVLLIVVQGATCSPHEGGSGCGFKVAHVIPLIIAVAFAGAAIRVMTDGGSR